ncbi:hypothetical protein, partial [Capnocytophaga leadbetteri]|uniref:hypothetical protein n=1 Tax=Capnocytophaga leadbetteri TaxID=327575 RepID=UPI003C7229E1
GGLGGRKRWRGKFGRLGSIGRAGKIEMGGKAGKIGRKKWVFLQVPVLFFGTLIKITYFCKILYLKQNQ